MVLRTQTPLLETAFAEIMNSSLHDLHRFTICARFFPYQFQDTFKHHQGIISTLSTTYEEDSVLFGSTTTGNCSFGGCIEYYRKEINEKWKYGRAFGWTRGRNSKSSWDRYLGYLKPRQWHAICIAIDLTEKTYDLLIENETYSFGNSFDKLSFDANILLFNVLGKQVVNSSFISSGSQEVTLPNLTSGIYIIQLETETGTINKKIVLE